MKLTEAEGKRFLQEAGISVPEFFLLSKDDAIPDDVFYPVIAKAQTLAGGRGKAGLVKEAADKDELESAVKTIWKGNYEKRPFHQILVEPKYEILREYYVSISYDQESKGPVIVISKFGGMNIETVAKRQPEAIVRHRVDILSRLDDSSLTFLAEKIELKQELSASFVSLMKSLYTLFLENDAELIEINPLIETKSGDLIAADCKMILDDAAQYRHENEFPQRTGSRKLTEKEQRAREIDARSHRGVVGRSYLELDGDIGFMSSGGGASITCLDALISYGGRPANFVEYSGNPERQDVKDLTKIVLSQDIKALWVVGPTANFTDIYETLAGIIDAIKEVQPKYPIVIRRAGPRDDEAKKMIEGIKKEKGMDITFYGEEVSMTESAKLLMEKLN